MRDAAAGPPQQHADRQPRRERVQFGIVPDARRATPAVASAIAVSAGVGRMRSHHVQHGRDAKIASRAGTAAAETGPADLTTPGARTRRHRPNVVADSSTTVCAHFGDLAPSPRRSAGQHVRFVEHDEIPEQRLEQAPIRPLTSMDTMLTWWRAPQLVSIHRRAGRLRRPAVDRCRRSPAPGRHRVQPGRRRQLAVDQTSRATVSATTSPAWMVRADRIRDQRSRGGLRQCGFG